MSVRLELLSFEVQTLLSVFLYTLLNMFWPKTQTLIGRKSSFFSLFFFMQTFFLFLYIPTFFLVVWVIITELQRPESWMAVGSSCCFGTLIHTLVFSDFFSLYVFFSDFFQSGLSSSFLPYHWEYTKGGQSKYLLSSALNLGYGLNCFKYGQFAVLLNMVCLHFSSLLLW